MIFGLPVRALAADDFQCCLPDQQQLLEIISYRCMIQTINNEKTDTFDERNEFIINMLSEFVIVP